MELIKINTTAKPRARPFEVLAGSAYDNTVIKQYLRSRAIKSSILLNTRNCKRKKKGRNTGFDSDPYSKRWTIERFFA